METEPTIHAVQEYLPLPAKERSGVALCLSGGGFRASLFHLGALRRLNELGVLSKIDFVSSVSGGSIISAHLAKTVSPWPEPDTIFPDWDATVAAPFKAFVSRNLRTPAILKRLLPWNWFRSSTGVQALADLYRKRLTQGELSQLPVRPRFIFCATDMAYGVNWEFTRDFVGDYQAGYADTPAGWLVARAVAASSCFPPVFNPLPVEISPSAFKGGKAARDPDWRSCVSGLRLTDGGNYDNMGLEPVWKNAKSVLVSDGGATFEYSPDVNLIWRLSRYTDILDNQVGAIRKRWLISSFVNKQLTGTYWGIGSDVNDYKPGGYNGAYPSDLVKKVIAKVRTDLDAFSKAEIAVLENHGYLLANAAIQRHAQDLAPNLNTPLNIPNPEWMDPKLVDKALAQSSKRKFPFGRW